MASLFTKTKLYIEANSKTWDDTKVSLQNNSDGNGDFISSWSYDIPEPTSEQLATYESSAQTEENNLTVIANRKSEYRSNTHQIENIIENGLEAEQTRVQAIKDKYPKETE